MSRGRYAWTLAPLKLPLLSPPGSSEGWHRLEDWFRTLKLSVT